MLRAASQAGGLDGENTHGATWAHSRTSSVSDPCAQQTIKGLSGRRGTMTVSNPCLLMTGSHQDLFVKLHKHTKQWFKIKVHIQRPLHLDKIVFCKTRQTVILAPFVGREDKFSKQIICVNQRSANHSPRAKPRSPLVFVQLRTVFYT